MLQGLDRPVVVLDFGAQYSKLIARRVRETKVFSLILPFDTPLEELKALGPAGIIFSGGPASVHEPNAPHPDPGLFDLGVPILGICYGVQLFADMLGGKVERSDRREYGIAHLDHTDGSGFLDGVDPHTQVWMSHGDAVAALPQGFEAIGNTENCPYAAIVNREKYSSPERPPTPRRGAFIENIIK